MDFLKWLSLSLLLTIIGTAKSGLLNDIAEGTGTIMKISYIPSIPNHLLRINETSQCVISRHMGPSHGEIFVEDMLKNIAVDGDILKSKFTIVNEKSRLDYYGSEGTKACRKIASDWGLDETSINTSAAHAKNVTVKMHFGNILFSRLNAVFCNIDKELGLEFLMIPAHWTNRWNIFFLASLNLQLLDMVATPRNEEVEAFTVYSFTGLFHIYYEGRLIISIMRYLARRRSQSKFIHVSQYYNTHETLKSAKGYVLVKQVLSPEEVIQNYRIEERWYDLVNRVSLRTVDEPLRQNQRASPSDHMTELSKESGPSSPTPNQISQMRANPSKQNQQSSPSNWTGLSKESGLKGPSNSMLNQISQMVANPSKQNQQKSPSNWTWSSKESGSKGGLLNSYWHNLVNQVGQLREKPLYQNLQASRSSNRAGWSKDSRLRLKGPLNSDSYDIINQINQTVPNQSQQTSPSNDRTGAGRESRLKRPSSSTKQSVEKVKTP